MSGLKIMLNDLNRSSFSNSVHLSGEEGCITEDFLGEFVSVFLRVDAVGPVVESRMSKSGRFD